MRGLLFTVSLLVLAAVLVPILSADDKPAPAIDGKKLMGNWEGKPTVDLGKDAKSLAEFGADGAVKLSVVSATLNVSSEGKYTLDGNKLSFMMKKPKENNYDVTISKLTENELEWRNSDDATITFKRVKAEKK